MQIPTSGAAERGIFYAVLPASFLFLVAMVWRYHLDFPFLDQWEFVPLLGKSFDNSVTLGDLWAQHNEHRLIFPRALMLLMAHMSGWDVRWELALNVLLGAGLFAVLAAQVMLTAKRYGLSRPHVLLACIALMVFSLDQWENWFLGWQMQEFMNVLAAVSGLFILANGPSSETRVAMAMLFGLVATYSFANGMAYWLVGVIVILLRGTRKAVQLTAWLTMSVVVSASYLYDYHPPEYHPSVMFLLSHPLEYAEYVLKYLGAAVCDFSETGALFAGGLCLYGISASMYVCMCGTNSSRSRLLPYTAIGLYGLLSALITGIGRVGFGGSQALSPRYIIFSNLVCFSCIAFVWIYVHNNKVLGQFLRRKILVICVLVFMGLIAFGSLYGAYRWTERYHFRMEARTELLRGDNPDLLQRVYQNPERILEVRPILREHHLSIFR